MKLPADSIVARAKMADYLLKWQPENDKSQFLAQAGYSAARADLLAQDIRSQLLPLDAFLHPFIEGPKRVEGRYATLGCRLIASTETTSTGRAPACSRPLVGLRLTR